MSDFSDAELCAIAGAVRDKELRTAKRNLGDGWTKGVDLTVRIAGQVAKGHGREDLCRLNGVAVFAAVLAQFGIGEKRLRRALQGVAAECLAENPTDPTHGLAKKHTKLQDVFGDVAKDVTAQIDPEHRPVRSGSVSAQVELTRVA